MRGVPSGSRHILSDAGTRLGRPRHGNTSCSRNIVIASPASISPPSTADSECIHSRGLMRHDRRIAGVGGLVCELQRPVGRRLKIVRGHKPSSDFFQHGKPRMSVREVKLSARRQHRRNDFCPLLHIGQPANGSPCCVDEIERAGHELRSLIYGALDEVCLKASLAGQTPCNIQRGAGKIEPGDSRAAPYQAQCIPTDMALQMQNALSKDVAEFGRFNRM